MSELRNTGIDALGEIPWGSHFCNFYETKQDLLDTLVPYFKAGLESNEFCLWVVSNSGLITVKEAEEALGEAVPELERHLSKKNIEILTELDWYLEENEFNLERVTNAWDVKLKRALALGYDGMRISGDTFWLKKKDWKNFCDYEKQVNDSFTDMPIALLCTYPLSRSSATEILDVVQNHKFALARRQGEWEIIESPELFQANLEIKRLNEELEQRVVERTKELAATNMELRREVAERKHAEALLHAKEQEFRAIVENAPDQIIRYDRNFCRTYVNPAATKAYGLPAEALIGKPVGSVIQSTGFDFKDDELALIRQRIAAVFVTGETCDFEMSWPVPEGRKYYSVRLFPELDLSGSVINVLGISRDITESKEAEEELRRSEDHIRLIIDTIPTMAWSLSAEGIVDFLNQRWIDYTGLSLEQFIEEPNRPIHPEDISRVAERWRKEVAVGEPYDDEMRLQRADGEYRWFLVRTAPLRDEQGNLVKWYGVSIDIENSKRTEDELRSAYQRLSYHVENTPLAVIELDKDLFIKRWSKRAEEIFGWKASEALGINVNDPDFPIIYADDIPAVDIINEQLKKGMVNSNLSLNRNFTKDGKVIYCEWYNSVLRDENGNVITILSLVHNVTEGKKAEEQKEFERRDKEALINTTDDMIWSVDTDFKLIAANKAFIRRIEALTGAIAKPGDELMLDFFPEDILTFWKDAYNRALSGETFKKEIYVHPLNKLDEAWREISFNPIYKNETVVGLACYSRDITERKKAEETLNQSYEEIRRLTEHLQKIREEERTSIAREIHDELGQQISVLKFDVSWLNKKLNGADIAIKEKVGDLIELLDTMVNSVRRISSELRPSLLDNLGLVPAMEWHLKEFEKRSGIKIIFNEPKEELETPDSMTNGLFRIFQESLTNVARHSGANKVKVELIQKNDQLILSIEDDGNGFDKQKAAEMKTLGILGMKERSLMMGGRYEITSVPGKGTMVTVVLPYKIENTLLKI
jgi:PAS domain S-box-containing protein